jgi:hypothetical protein
MTKAEYSTTAEDVRDPVLARARGLVPMILGGAAAGVANLDCRAIRICPSSDREAMRQRHSALCYASAATLRHVLGEGRS